MNAESDGLPAALALISTAAATICLSLVVALLAFRSGLGTPPSILLLCAAIVLSSAYAPFLAPNFHQSSWPGCPESTGRCS
jgi:hypothetical protein